MILRDGGLLFMFLIALLLGTLGGRTAAIASAGLPATCGTICFAESKIFPFQTLTAFLPPV